MSPPPPFPPKKIAYRQQGTPWEQPTSQAFTSGTSLWYRSLYLRRRKQLLVKTKQTSEKKKKTENVVMINGRSNDGH